VNSENYIRHFDYEDSIFTHDFSYNWICITWWKTILNICRFVLKWMFIFILFQDSAGEIETKLYKGDVLATIGGGAQVIMPWLISSSFSWSKMKILKTRWFSIDYFGVSLFNQVILQDVEVLRHSSPTALKRNSEGRPKDVLSRVTDIESRCAIAIEGHRSKKHCVWKVGNWTWKFKSWIPSCLLFCSQVLNRNF